MDSSALDAANRDGGVVDGRTSRRPPVGFVDPEISRAALCGLAAYLGSQGITLPPGFFVRLRTRKEGASKGTNDVYFYGPNGHRFRSRAEVLKVLSGRGGAGAGGGGGSSDGGVGARRPSSTDVADDWTAFDLSSRRRQGLAAGAYNEDDYQRPSSDLEEDNGFEESDADGEGAAAATGNNHTGAPSSSSTSVEDLASHLLAARLRSYVSARSHGNLPLPPGWRAVVTFDELEGKHSASYVSPGGQSFETKADVLASLEQERNDSSREGGEAVPSSLASPLNAKSTIAAAMLLELPVSAWNRAGGGIGGGGMGMHGGEELAGSCGAAALKGFEGKQQQSRRAASFSLTAASSLSLAAAPRPPTALAAPRLREAAALRTESLTLPEAETGMTTAEAKPRAAPEATATEGQQQQLCSAASASLPRLSLLMIPPPPPPPPPPQQQQQQQEPSDGAPAAAAKAATAAPRAKKSSSPSAAASTHHAASLIPIPRSRPPPPSASDAGAAALELRRLAAAVLAAGGPGAAPLAPGWRADVRTRRDGGSKGAADIYYYSPGGARFRSVAQALRSIGLVPRATPRAAPGSRLSSGGGASGSGGGRGGGGRLSRSSGASGSGGSGDGGSGDGAAAADAVPFLAAASALPAPAAASPSPVGVAERPEAAAAAAPPPAEKGEEGAAAAAAFDDGEVENVENDDGDGGIRQHARGDNGSSRRGGAAGSGSAAANDGKAAAPKRGGGAAAGGSNGGGGAPANDGDDDDENRRGRRSNGGAAAAASDDSEEEDEEEEETDGDEDEAAAAAAAAPSSPRGGGAAAGRPRRENAPRPDYGLMEQAADIAFAMEGEEARRKAAAKNKNAKGRNADAADTSAAAEKKKKEAADESKREERNMKSEYAHLITRARSAISRWRRESTLVETFEADAARGAGGGRRIRLGAEVERARRACDTAKATLIECVRQLEEAGGDQKIPEEKFDPETGEVGEEDVFCGKCGDFESSDNNDIILCDGGCSRAYHALSCCTPPVDVSQLDPDDGWLCPACEAKADVLRAINAEFGYEYEQEVRWGEIFAGPPPAPQESSRGGGTPRRGRKRNGGGSDGDDESEGGAAEGGTGNAALLLAGGDLPSDDDEEDEDFDDEDGGGDSSGDRSEPTDSSSSDEDDDDKKKKKGRRSGGGGTSSASSASSDSESESESDLSDSDSARDDTPVVRSGRGGGGGGGALSSESGGGGKKKKKGKEKGKEKGETGSSARKAAGATSSPTLSSTGKRRRRRRRGGASRVDYAALNAELFGDHEAFEGEGSESADADWGPKGEAKGGKSAAAGGGGGGAPPGSPPASAGGKGKEKQKGGKNKRQKR